MADGLGVGGPPLHLQHHGAARQQEVGQTRALPAVDLGGGDPEQKTRSLSRSTYN